MFSVLPQNKLIIIPSIVYKILQLLIALQRLQQRYPSCMWIAGQAATAKHELSMAEKENI